MGSKAVGGGVGGGGLAGLVVYVSGRLGAHLTADDASAALFTAMLVGAFVAHHGLIGIFKLILRGEQAAVPAPAPAPPPPPPPG